jgi:hypothetical protein
MTHWPGHTPVQAPAIRLIQDSFILQRGKAGATRVNRSPLARFARLSGQSPVVVAERPAARAKTAYSARRGQQGPDTNSAGMPATYAASIPAPRIVRVQPKPKPPRLNGGPGSCRRAQDNGDPQSRRPTPSAGVHRSPEMFSSAHAGASLKRADEQRIS